MSTPSGSEIRRMGHGDVVRGPDFIIVGAMKAGTTTLFRWLERHPQCGTPSVKEPHFFSRDDEFARGPSHYLEHFSVVPGGLLTGEASASYADPRISSIVAARMRALLPGARLIYLVRHPEQRLRSHYLHEWQRSRERRPLRTALADDGNAYTALSRYADAIRPFVDTFGRDSVLLTHLSDLASPESDGWRQVARFLRLEPVPGAGERANVAASKVGYNPLTLKLWESGWLRAASRLPQPIRRGARRLLNRQTAALQQRAAEVAREQLPADVRAQLAEQWQAVHDLFGQPAPVLSPDGDL